MKSNITFGECLKYLLNTLEISMSRLSKVINVDSSLINRWIHGTRIPPYGTSYIEKIAEFLTKNIYNTYQIEMLNELFKDVCGEKMVIDNAEEKIKKILLESQGYSIEKRKKEKTVHKHYYVKQNQNYKLHNKHIAQQVKSEISNSNFINSSKNVHLSQDDMIIYEIDNIISAGISLIETAAKQKSTKNDAIYITFDNLDYTNFSNNKLIFWRESLLKAVENDWQINYLMKMDGHLNFMLIFIKCLLPLIKSKKVNIYSLDRYDSFPALRPIFLASGIGAMSCFPSSKFSNVDSCFYIKNEAAIDIFKNYMDILIKTQAHSILNYYSQDKNDEYYNLLCEMMGKNGNQLYYNTNLNIFLMPEELYKKLLLRNNLEENAILQSLLYYRKQFNSLMLSLQNNKLKEIYLTESMDNLINHQFLYLNTYYGFELVELESEEIIEYIQNIIKILNGFDNYQVAIIHNTNEHFENMKECNFTIKERQGVFFYIVKHSEYASEVRLSINEPAIVKAFEEYFNDLWSRISPINKDKKDIIAWLQSYIDVLNKRINCD